MHVQTWSMPSSQHIWAHHTFIYVYIYIECLEAMCELLQIIRSSLQGQPFLWGPHVFKERTRLSTVQAPGISSETHLECGPHHVLAQNIGKFAGKMHATCMRMLDFRPCIHCRHLASQCISSGHCHSALASETRIMCLLNPHPHNDITM